MKIKVGYQKGFNGYQPFFGIGKQTFLLSECIEDTEEDSLEMARWYVDQLKAAFEKVKVENTDLNLFAFNDSEKVIIDKLKEEWDNHYGKMKFSEQGLELHTGGWSENEQIIDDLSQTIFWIKYWYATDRGGHYYFDYRLNKKN